MIIIKIASGFEWFVLLFVPEIQIVYFCATTLKSFSNEYIGKNHVSHLTSTLRPLHLI